MRRFRVLFGQRRVRILVEWLVFAALALAATYPLMRVVGTHLPQGAESCATVPLLNMWTIWWNVEALEHFYLGYWDAPIYHPTPGILAFTEPQTVVGWAAWPLWHMLPGPASVYNVLVLVFLTLNGWVSCQLLKRWRLSWLATLAGGAMVGLLPLLHWQLGIFQLISVWGICWTLLALQRFRHAPGPAAAVHLAIAFACTYSLCCYYGLFLAILLLASAPLLLGRQLLQKNVWLWGLVSVMVAALLLCPIVVPQVSITSRQPLDYPDEWIRTLSALPKDYWQTPVRQLVSLPEMPRDADRYSWALSPGTLKTAAAMVGVGIGVWTRRRRRIVLFLVCLAVFAVLLSMGPNLQWRGLSLYRFLSDYVPGFARARNVCRFAIFLQIAVALLAAIGLHGLQVLVQRRARARTSRLWVSVAVLSLGALLAGEAWPSRPGLYSTPTVVSDSPWISWLRRPEQSSVVLAFFPLPDSAWAPSFQQTTEWMFCQMWHARPMINGYATFQPDDFGRLRGDLLQFPSGQAVAALRELGATHCVIDHPAGAAAAPGTLAALGLECVLDDAAAGIQIWRLPPSPQSPAGR